MKVLLIHTHYKQRGGEDYVVERESNLLREKGHEVIPYIDDNQQQNRFGWVKTITRILWSQESYHALRTVIRRTRPEVAHIHNTFFMISPSAYYACKAENLPVVQTLHNYRLLCPSAIFYRHGQVCEKCIGKKIAWPGIVHGCYHYSRAQTLGVASMLTFHHLLGTWLKKVDLFIALTEFARRKFLQGGFPSDKIAVKPNFVQPNTCPNENREQFALFVGRLTNEKGIMTLLKAWKKLTIPLLMAGDGPLKDRVHQVGSPWIHLLGNISHQETLTFMRKARLLVFPSEWFEGFPLVLAEAFSCGLPVIAANLGSGAEIVKDKQTGLHFTPGDALDFAAKVRWAWDNPAILEEMGKKAFLEFETNFTSEKNYEKLMTIYNLAATNHCQGDRP